ncbi:MAG: response regulator, partial [Chthoniobacterales bacterium]
MNDPVSQPVESNSRVLVLAPDEHLANAVLAALREAAPNAHVDLAVSLEEAQQLVLNQRPNLFVLDVDATYDLGQEFLYDLRTSHPNARAIVLTAVHLAQQRERAAGIGAIHFLEKPFPHNDFVTLVEALLLAGEKGGEEKFQGTLSDLHIADIIQLKCMSGATSALEFTGPRGEKARVYFEEGQVRHAVAPGKEGIEAFNEIVEWKGGMISEVSGGPPPPRTIDLDWQMLLMEAVRKMDEQGAAGPTSAVPRRTSGARKILVIDDSVMLLNFVKEILGEANYQVVAAATAEEGLRAAAAETPDLILLDYVLPDMKGDEVLGRLLEGSNTAPVPVVYMSGFGTDLKADPKKNPNVIGSLNKPFTSELLLKTVETYMPKDNETSATPMNAPADATEQSEPAASNWTPQENFQPVSEAAPENTAPLFAEAATESQPAQFESAETSKIESAVGGGDDAWWSAAPSTASVWPEPAPQQTIAPFQEQPQSFAAPMQIEPASGDTYFCGDTSFFSLNWALHAIGTQKLTGTLRSFWDKEPVELLARDGKIILVTTRDPELYCLEAPITLVNIEEARVIAARQQQRETSQPLFLTLAQEGLILREPAMQLVQHYGQKLFAQLWSAPRVRFIFEQSNQLPDFVEGVPSEEDIDHWALSTLRFIQFQDVAQKANYDQNSIPA